MEIKEFVELVSSARRSHPGWFMLQSDSAATESEVEDAQLALGVALVPEYRRFLEIFGGGDFAFMNVFSVDPSSEWNIVERNRAAGLVGTGFLAISDDETGGLYGFRVVKGVCEPAPCYLDVSTREIVPTKYRDVLSFIAAVGLRQEAV